MIRKPTGAALASGGNRALVVIRLIGTWKPDHLLVVARFLARRNENAVGHDIIDPWRPKRTGIAEPLDLHSCRPPGQDRTAGRRCPSLHVDGDVATIVRDALGDGIIRQVMDRYDMLERILQAPSRRAAGRRRIVVGEDLEAGA